MDNKRILTFSEFTKAYSKGDQFSAPGNDEKSVEKMQDATDNLTDNPNIPGSKGDMDAISSKPATRFIKTDYEKSPEMPKGPVKLKDLDDEEASVEKSGEKPEKKAKPVKKIKKDSKKSEEEKREESGEY